MYESVESVQIYLPTIGVVLFPLEIGKTTPPKFINDEQLYALGARVFKSPNLSGALYEYKRNTLLYRWELIENENQT